MKIAKEIIIATDRHGLFPYLIEPFLLESWFCSECESRPGEIISPGVEFRLWFLLANREYSFEGRYIEVRNFERVAFERRQKSKSTVVEIGLADLAEGKTKIKVSEFGSVSPRQEKFRDKMWDFYLVNLKNVVEGGFDERHKVLGQIVKESIVARNRQTGVA